MGRLLCFGETAMHKPNFTQSVETVSYVIVAPAVQLVGDDYCECEAVFCYDNTNFNPSVYWCADVHYSSAYDCTTYSTKESLSRFDGDYLARTKLTGSLVSVDLDHRKIIKVTRSTSVVETYEEEG